MSLPLLSNRTASLRWLTAAMSGLRLKLVLLSKLLRDYRWPLFFVGLLLAVYQVIWAKLTERIVQTVSTFTKFMPLDLLKSSLFQGPGQAIQAIIGGDLVGLDQPAELMTVAYVHPVTLTIFGIWAIGRSSGALAGEVDRGTMELLLAQPLARWRLVFTHFLVDLITIPVLCLCMIFGTWAGVNVVGIEGVDLRPYAGALLNAGVMIFAISGYTMAMSACGRFRWRVLSFALGVSLVQFFINLLAQMWDRIAFLRPLTIFYYYQPQAIILKDQWTVPIGKDWPWLGGEVYGIVVLLLVGAIGYALALLVFSRRDLPAPL